MQKKCHPKVLYIVSRFPWPLDSGIHVRQYHMLRALSKYSDVDILVMPPEATNIPEEIKSLCRQVFVYPREAFLTASRKNAIGKLMQIYRELSGWPLDDIPPEENRIPSDMVKVLNGNYDVVWIAKLGTAMRICHSGGQNVVLDLDDIEHLKIKRMAAVSNGNFLRKIRLSIYSRAWRLSEMEALKNFACVVVCSWNDKKYLGNRDNISIVPNGFMTNADIKFHPGVTGRMFYVGNMEYLPNDDAVCYFIRNILPDIRAQNPEAHLVVAGANPSKKLKEMSDGKIVKLLGRVDDVTIYLKESALSIVPLRIGGGTRLKILESLANKVPVVSTTIGAEGLELEQGKHILIADEPKVFADSCIRLLTNRNLRMQLAENGYEQVYKKYSYNTIDEQIGEIIKNLCK